MISDIYNYADDNSICTNGNDYESAQSNILECANIMLKWFKENYLQANPSKFQFIVFDKQNISHSLKINDHDIVSTGCVKLLGVSIDNQLNFKQHISIMCRKAGKQLNVLSRLSRCMSLESKMLLYQTFILSHFNYCPLVWHFCTLEDTKKIGKIQERALRYVYNDFKSSYLDLLHRADKPFLYIQRIKHMMLFVYKCNNNVGPTYLHNMFKPKDNIYKLRNKYVLEQPLFNTVTYGKRSLKYEGSKLWNTLDNDVKNSLNSFKMYIKQWQGFSCKCSYCTYCILANR